MKKRYLFILWLFITFNSFGQRVELGGGLGVSNYRGDFTPIPKLKNTSYSIQGTFKYNLTAYLSLRFNLSYTHLNIQNQETILPISGSENDYFFRSKLFDNQVSLEYYFLNFNVKKPKPPISPYFHTGIGLSAFRTTTPSNESDDIIPVNSSFTLVYGLGLKYRLNDKFNLYAEFSTINSFSDELDNFKTSTFDDDFNKIRQSNFQGKDTYYTFTLGFTYRFISSSCRPFLQGPSPPAYKKRNRKYDRPF